MAKKSDRLRVGIVGAGMISKDHIKGYQRDGRAEIAAVCDTVAERAERAAAEVGAKPFSDYQEMVRTAGLDAISVCVPPALHAPVTVAAAQAGVHVLCEKPMTFYASEAKRMVQACQAAGVQLGLASARVGRLRAQMRAARRAVAEQLGDVYYGRFSGFRVRGRPGADFYKDTPWFLNARVAGGGALYDMGCYDVDAILFLLGSPQPLTVSAMAYRGFALPEGFDKPFDVDEHVTAFIRFASGPAFTLERGWVTNLNNEGHRLELFGTRAGLKNYETLTALKDGKIVESPIAPEGTDGDVFADFVSACLENRPPATPGADGQKVMEILAGALLSARLGREVTITELYEFESLREGPPGWPTA